uniref:Uncharacterized protein n=1 Tax=Arcella intermedia TaxID=1963864 RepID=A0A6B2LJH2_9EUKA
MISPSTSLPLRHPLSLSRMVAKGRALGPRRVVCFRSRLRSTRRQPRKARPPIPSTRPPAHTAARASPTIRRRSIPTCRPPPSPSPRHTEPRRARDSTKGLPLSHLPRSPFIHPRRLPIRTNPRMVPTSPRPPTSLPSPSRPSPSTRTQPSPPTQASPPPPTSLPSPLPHSPASPAPYKSSYSRSNKHNTSMIR